MLINQKVLLKSVEPYAKYLARRYSTGPCFSEEDVYSTAMYGAFLALQNFDSEKGSFLTYASRRMFGEIMEEFRKFYRQSLPLIDPDKRPVKYKDMEEIKDEVRKVLSTLSRRDRNIIFCVLGLGETQVRVGKRCGISESRVSQIVKYFLRRKRRQQYARSEI